MPVLDYGHLLAPGGLYRAQIAVRTVMAWPDIADVSTAAEKPATGRRKSLPPRGVGN